MNFWLNTYARAVAYTVSKSGTGHGSYPEKKKRKKRWFSCFTRSKKQVCYYLSPESANNSTHSVTNIITDAEINRFISNMPEYNTQYIPKINYIYESNPCA